MSSGIAQAKAEALNAEKREAAIRRWFEMWLKKEDLGIRDIFAPDAVYIESWGPEYHGAEKIRHWFREWNTRGTVLQWDILQFFHTGDQTVAEWYFRNRMDDGHEDVFDGMSLVRWNEKGQMVFLKEFGCNRNRYDPYRDGPKPRFRDEKAAWF